MKLTKENFRGVLKVQGYCENHSGFDYVLYDIVPVSTLANDAAKLTNQELLRIINSVLKTIIALHKRNIAHNLIFAENIFLTEKKLP